MRKCLIKVIIINYFLIICLEIIELKQIIEL
jgi:hypothetical protein